MQNYTMDKTSLVPTFTGDWDGPVWGNIHALEIASFHEKSSNHRPQTLAKVIYDDTGVYVIFHVSDRYVRCVDTTRNGRMCADSCVEWFVEPVAGRGYFNFEINCGGTLLAHYNAQSAAIRYDPVEIDDARLDLVRIFHSMPRVVDPEITESVEWVLEFFVPFELFESFVGPVNRDPLTIWRANFYKCGDATSHPHWAMWNLIPVELGFHKPEFFAPIRFG